jgi:hypothetical protein
MKTRFIGLTLGLLLLSACDRAAETDAGASAKGEAPAAGERWTYPRERTIDGRRVVVHAPQIRSWPQFERFTAQVALELPDGDAKYAVIDLSGDTAVDKEARLVKVAHPKVDRVTFTGTPGAEQESGIRAAVEREPLEVPLDVFLYYLADGVIESPPPDGFNTDPPPIHVVETPTYLLLINGEAVTSAIGKSGLELVVNANFPVVRDTADGRFYLLTGKYRYTAAKLAGPWGAVQELPAAFGRIPGKGEYEALAAVAASAPASGLAPRVIASTKPAEIVVLEGEAKAEEIPGTGGLEAITNTTSPLFRLDGTYYLLLSGRWFSTRYLLTGPWKFTMPLPEAFARIPPEHASAAVRASVPGTLEARRAALEAELPEKHEVKAGAAPTVSVSYAGEPRFEPIAETGVSRAVNTGLDILEHGGKYYLCYQGAWYVASAPTGPWSATADVPAAIYQIPPSSPSYPVTQVTVVHSDEDSVTYGYPAAYATGMFVAFGVAYYGTGWYYPPYAYGPYYYPYYGSYGHGSWYNPNTGRYGSRSAWYGPYGGYSYNQAYNPRTGRYGAVETAWDGDEWVSSGATYNPRTGISTETDRHYSDDSNKLKTDRTVEGPRGNEMDVERTTDFDDRTSTTERKTDRGGKSEVTRKVDDSGRMTTSGTVKTADGRTATIEGEHRRGEGSTTIAGSEGGSATIDRERNADGSVTREGSFSKDGQTVDTATKRDGRSSITAAEGSEGGRAISASDGLGNRTTIAESGSGDLYAGHGGDVYKRTDDGWQKHENGGWQDVETPERGGQARESAEFSREQFDAASRDAARAQAAEMGAGQYGQRSENMGAASSRTRPSYQETERLNRDAAARHGGYQNFNNRHAQRPSGMSRGMRPRRR